MKDLKDKILINESVTISDADFDDDYKGKDVHNPIEMKINFIPTVEYCYFIDEYGNVMDWINSNDNPDETVGSKGTFYFKCEFKSKTNPHPYCRITIWAVIETNAIGDVNKIKMNRSGINAHNPIGFNELADLLYDIGKEYEIGYFEDKDKIIRAFENCDLYL